MAVIASTVQNQSVTLIKSPENFNWDEFPVVLSKGERDAIDFTHVVSVLTGTIESPLTKAKNRDSSLFERPCQLIIEIDRIFTKLMHSLKEESERAQEKDSRVVRIVISSYKDLLPSMRVWLIVRIFNENYINEQVCCHRKLWINSIHILEIQRTKQMKKKLTNRITEIKQQLIILQKAGEKSISLENEYNQLCVFSDVHFNTGTQFAIPQPSRDIQDMPGSADQHEREGV